MENTGVGKDKRNLVIVLLATVGALLLAAVIVLAVILGQQMQPNLPVFKEYYDLKCQAYEVQNTNLAKGQIVFIGDSITDLYVLDDHYADLPLAVYNRGIGGDYTQGVLDRLKVSLYDIAPEYVVLMIGTNDVDFGVPTETTVENYAKILDEIYTNMPDVKLYCMSIIPQNMQLQESSGLDVAANTRKIMAINSQIKTLAEAKGATYLDLFSLLADENNYLIADYSDDGLHLNVAGLQVWTELLKPHLLADMEK